MQTRRKEAPVMNRRVATATPPPSYNEVTVEPLAEPGPVGDTELRVSWVKSALLVAPGIGLLVLGLLIGADTLGGILLVVLASAYLVLEALFVQPRLAFHLPGLELERVALEFTRRRMYNRTLAELAGTLEEALSDGLGIDEILLILQSADGQLSFGGDAEAINTIRNAPQALSFLQRHGGIVTRDQLADLEEEDASAAAALTLLERLDADVFLSFCQDGQLMGFAAFDFPWKNSDYAEAFLEVVGESMTSGLINQHLRRQAGGREALTQVFALAQAMQGALLPDTELVELESVALQGWSDPAEHCGGDLWAWHELGSGKLLLFVADATGHGVSPATLAAAVSGALAAHACAQGEKLEPDLLLGELNTLVRSVGRSHHMMSAFAAVYDPRLGELRFANAGHNPPLLWRGVDDTGLKALKVEGSMLGSADELQFKRDSFRLAEDDMLFLFTDGIVEAGEPHLARLGHREFRKTLVECAGREVSDACVHMKERVLEHLGDMAAGDDMTFVALRFTEMVERTR